MRSAMGCGPAKRRVTGARDRAMMGSAVPSAVERMEHMADEVDGQARTVEIGTTLLRAEVALHGAELVRLRDEAGRDLLWDGDPAYWTGRAPILFPIVGRLKDDRATVDGVAHPMRQHGIARISTFRLVEHDGASCRLRLTADDASRRAYPYDFALDLDYRVDGASLRMAGTVRNAGAIPMPASFGFHPAFRRPLPYGAAAADHAVTFATEEPEPIAAVEDGLLADERRPSPLRGRTLDLAPHLFDRDALIFLEPRSRSVHYGPPGGRGLTVDFADMPQLGLWSKPGAPFLCIEPWSGHASPVGFDGDLAEKPGMTVLTPGESRTFAMRVTLDPE